MSATPRRRGAVLHEPALFSLFDEPKGVRETLVQLIKDAMEAGAPAAAFERFIRFGPENLDRSEELAQTVKPFLRRISA